MALFAIFAMGVMLALRYWVLPDIETYHNDVTRLASRALGLQVTIGQIKADWYGLSPHLLFTDVRLLDGQGNSALVLKRVDNVVSWMTLLRGELRLKTLEVDEPDLSVRRDKQGVLHVAGLQISGQSADDKLSDWLLHQSHILVRNGKITWQDDLYDRPPLLFSGAQLRLDNSGKHHRFAIRLAPLATVSAPLDVRGDLVGSSFLNWEDWRGEVYAQISRADVAAWGAWLTLPEEFSRAKGGVRAWLEVGGGQLNRITADLDLSEVRSHLAANLPVLDLSALHGRVAWRALERGFEVSTRGLALKMANGFQLFSSDIKLRLAGDKQNRFAAGELQANSIELADFAVLAEYLPLDKGLKQKLGDFSPGGHVTDIKAQWQVSEESPARFDVKARFDGVSLRRVGNFPGIGGLSGHVEGNDNSGVLSLNAPRIKLDVPQLLLEPVAFDTLLAKASWQRKQDGWDIKLNNFSIANQDLAGTVFGNYQTEVNGLGIADITLNLTRASVRHIARYLPKELMGKETMTWLQAALLGGEAEEISLRLRGDLKDFPFPDNKKGIFQVKVKAKDLIVDYAKDWPRVDNASATMLIEGQRLQIDSSNTTIMGIKIQKGNAVIPDLTAQETLLQIGGETSAETRLGLNFIKHSPIRNYINGFTDNSTALGSGKLSLQIDLPLSNKPVRVKGKYHFFDNEVNLDEGIPVGRKVNGDLLFTESALQAKDISAQVLGGATSMSIQTAANGLLKVNLRGKIDPAVWRKVNPDPRLPLLSGSADWNGEVTVFEKQFAVLITSNLHGLGSDFPAPFNKPAHESIPVKYELRSAGAAQDVMWLQYGDKINARMVRAEDAHGVKIFNRGYINFGPAQRVLDKDGVWITGTVPVLSLEGWQGMFQSSPGTGLTAPEIDGADVLVQKVTGYGSVVNGMSIHARNRNGTTTAQLASKDLNGEISWTPQGKGKFVARLKNAVLGVVEKQTEAAKAGNPELTANEAFRNITVPLIDVAVDRFVYQGKQYGRLELHISQLEKDSILLNSMTISNSDGVLTGSGKWNLFPSQTHLVSRLDFNNFGNMLGRIDIVNYVKDGRGTLNSDVVWAGAPFEFLRANLDGHLSMEMGKGQFPKIESSPGKGFEFDKVSGEAKISKGILSANEVKVNGPAANVILSGQVDWPRETQNLRARVTPKIGDGFSLLAFAAGPAVGAGVFIANKLLRDPLDKLAAFEYNVSGSWKEPKVEKVGRVNAPPQNNPEN